MADESGFVEQINDDSTFCESDYEAAAPPSDIVAFSESRSCADILRMYQQQILEVKPHFQRDFIWSNADQTRFIDSLIKQLPIPSLCLSFDYKTQRWQVIDGLQRISTIIRFLTDEGWVLAKLDDIDQAISGQKASDFDSKSIRLQRMRIAIENLTLPITVIRCDYSKKSHQEYLFNIFHRLNTGGTRLSNQEIRNCIYSGSFNELLHELNRNSQWGKILGTEKEPLKRFRGQELILRFFAFGERLDVYSGKLASFLNEYMSKNRDLTPEMLAKKTNLFEKTTSVIADSLDEYYPFPSAAILEGVLAGVAANIAYLQDSPSSEIQKRYMKMTNKDAFSKESLSEGLARKERLVGRLTTAIETFGP